MNQTKTPRDKLLLGLGLGLGILALAIVIAAAVMLINMGAAMLAPLLPTEPAPTLPPLATNPYSPEDFVPDENGYMTLASGDYMLGIDVSEWNGNIDWQEVKDAGVEFVYIRVGGRGWGQAGVMYGDGLAQAYYEGAKEQGLLIGAYFFSQAATAEEAREEALYCLEATAGWEMDLPIVMDWEYISDEGRTNGMTRRQRTDCVLEFCRTVARAGKRAALYTGWDILQNWMYPHELEEIPFWLAMYTTNMDYPYRFAVWQYTGSGRVPGISTDVDMNIMPIK